MSENESGKFAYESYCESVKTTFDNLPLPTWEQLGERQKNGWIACYGEVSKREKKIWYLRQMFSIFLAQKELKELNEKDGENESSPF
jgi:hypothetical protein